MITLNDIESGLTALFPDERVAADFYAAAGDEGMVRGDAIRCEVRGMDFFFPIPTEITVLTRVCQFDHHCVSKEVRIVVAVGGVVDVRCGIVTPRYFLAKLYYNQDCEVNRLDVDTSEAAL